MPLDETQLDSFGSLARAMGITTATGTNSKWFADPMGGSIENPNGLGTILFDDAQRTGLTDFVDEVLGPPEGRTEGQARWVPLFHEADPDVTIHAVLEPVPGAVNVGIGLDFATGDTAPLARIRLHVPIFRLPRAGAPFPAHVSDLPAWLLLGNVGGRISIGCEAVFTDEAPTPGVAFLRGANVQVGIPTNPGDSLAFSLDLTDLQLPGATAPTTRSLSTDQLDDLGSEVLEFIVGLIQAQIEALALDNPAFAKVRGLAGMLGLREVPGLPALPLADLATRGADGFVTWIESILTDETKLGLWLGQLVDLVGGTANPSLGAVEFSIDAVELTLGLRVTPGTGGHPVLVPWVSLGYDTRAGAKVAASLDLLKFDTASGSCSAIPSLRAEALFGDQAAGTALLTGATALGGIRLGVGLENASVPRFLLTAHHVTIAGHTHDVLDLSSPDAALDAVDDVVSTALGDALHQLGAAGDLLVDLLGVESIAITDLVANPLAALRAHYATLLGRAPDAAALWGHLRSLLTGVPDTPVAGDGSIESPWRIELFDAVGIDVSYAADVLRVALGVDLSVPVGQDYTARMTAAVTLLRADLAAGQVALAEEVLARLTLGPGTGTTARLDLRIGEVVFDRVGIGVRWSAATRFRVETIGDGLGIAFDDTAFGLGSGSTGNVISLALPTWSATGELVWEPDWDDLEVLLSGLLSSIDSPAVRIPLDLLGWIGTGAHLGLSDLVADPVAAVEAWLTGLTLDCGHLALVLRPVAWLLSGGLLEAPTGRGRPESPYRCPIAGEVRAPALVAWTVPGCPPGPGDTGPSYPDRLAAASDGPSLVDALVGATPYLPQVSDLLAGRPRLGEGLDALATRWAGTDGVVGPPDALGSLPAGVAGVTLAGRSLGELTAAARSGVPYILGDLIASTAAVVQVGTDPDWLDGVPASTGIDASGAAPGTIDSTASGTWFVRVATPAAAAASRSDHDGVAGQAEQLAAVLAGRSAPIVLVAHGAAGAAAVRAASARPAVSAVVTVGTPWTGVAVAGLHTGLPGDALRFLASIAPTGIEAWPERLLAEQATALMRGLAMVRHAAAVLAAEDLPSAQSEPVRAGLEVRAIFGAVDEQASRAAVLAVVTAGVDELQRAADALPTGPATELDVGIDVPVFDLALGDVFVGAGARMTLLRLVGDGPSLQVARSLTVTARFGVTDGWLVGGPGAGQHDVEARWGEVRIDIPLDGSPGSGEVVLHEARCFEVAHDRWVIRGGSDLDVTAAALPEAKIVLSQVVARLLAASPDLADLLNGLGITRGGGLDPGALDHLLFDPAPIFTAAVAAAPARIADALRRLLGEAADVTGTTSTRTDVTISVGPAQVSLDLGSGLVTASATVAPDGIPPLTVTATSDRTGTDVDLTWGAFESDVGGARLIGSVTGRRGGASLRAEVRPGPAAAPTTTIPLWPTLDVPGLTTLLRAALPAAVFRVLLDGVRDVVEAPSRDLIDSGLEALGLLPGTRDSLVPGATREIAWAFGLFNDPIGWLTTRVDPVQATIAVLDALAPLVAPGRGISPGWPVADGFTITYAAVGDRLEVRAALDLDTTVGAGANSAHVTAAIVGGLSIGRAGAPLPIIDARIAVDDYGLDLGINPAVRLSLLRPAPGAPISLYPSGPGVGTAILAGAESLLPRLVDELVGHRDDAGSSVVKDVASVVHDLLLGIGLLTDAHQLDLTAVRALADSPAQTVLDRLPGLVSLGLGSLAHGLDPTGGVVAVANVSATVRRFTFGGDVATVTLDSVARSISFGAAVVVGPSAHPTGRIRLNALTLSPLGVQVDVVAGPFVLDLGTFTLRPVIVARAGVSSAGFTRALGIGVAMDELGSDTVEFRWTLDGNAPSLAAVARAAGVENVDLDPVAVGTRLLSVALSIASGILTEHLGPVISSRATDLLQGVVLTGGDLTIDPGFITDLVVADAMLRRLERLAFNCATATSPLALTIEDEVTITLVGTDIGSGRHRLGLAISLAGNKPFVLADGDVGVALVVDNTWITPGVAAGLTITLLEGTATDLVIEPGFTIGGIGLRFSTSSGPLLDLGSIALDAIEVDVYAEANSTGVGGGARLKLDGLAFAPGGGGGDNGVANSMMNDVGSASQNNRPAFSPALALQKHPTSPLGFSLTAGDPPGPWWIVIQRQLGPLYVERIGFNSVEQNGRVVKISLLFTGQVSLFGLTAAVDSLSINWNGGDILALASWSVDLAGLAISAEMAGLSLAGGLLKTESSGSVSYVGMLVGRFAAYGLSVFGGYTNDHGNASFFVFGAVNGPIGGPPAFFITGLGGGLGINRGLVVPDDISKFGEYPFIQALDPAAQPPADPMDELRKLSEYFPHHMGNFWFAAGISFTCFSLVDGVAVVAVSFGDGLEIDLFGLARMALPRPGAALVSIELALLARFSTREGLFMIKAQLTDNSWLLYEDVRLTGGFAFAIWWKGPLAGQFVLSIGGYHPDFHRDGYPVVPRLGIHWQVSSAIVVKGGAYFALTSEALMAGVEVEASADFGWAWAKVAFGANGIVYFDPFWFEVEVYARISAGISISLGFLGHLSLSVSLGASIKVWGPDFAGKATFEVGPCDISVGFGSERRVEPAVLDWGQFVTKYLEDAGNGQARALSGITGKGTLPTATGGKTGAPTADGTIALPFRVFAEFELTITTTVPATRFSLAALSVTVPGPGSSSPIPASVPTSRVPSKRSDGSVMSLGLSPMVAHGLAAPVTVTLSLQNEITGQWVDPLAEAVSRLGANLTSHASPDGTRVGTGSFPLGVWGIPQPLGLKDKALPTGDIVNAGNQFTLVAVAEMEAVGPQILYRQVESTRRPLPLQATGPERSAFLQVAHDLDIVHPVTSMASFALATATIFAAAPAQVTGAEPPEGLEELLPTGAQSRVAQASYANHRAAPPIFGSLTDGLAKTNGAAGERDRLHLPTAPSGRAARRPEVIAHLASGVGAVIRAGATTVSDQRFARRPAPTVDSVRGRLGLHLPLVLTRSAAPAIARAGTVMSIGGAPRTDVSGAARAFTGSRVAAPGLQELVGGLGAKAGLIPGSPRDRAIDRAINRALTRPAAGGTSRRALGALSRDVPPRSRDISSAPGIRPGDVIVLESPDAALDVSDQARPSLAVTGNSRVVMLAGRATLADAQVRDGSVEVPPGTSHVLVQADGDVTASGGLAGWHDRSRVVRLGSHLGLAAGCVVSVDAAGSGAALRWTSAGDLVQDADEVTTRFSRPVRTVAVVLTGTTPRGFDPASLHLIGATLRSDRGQDLPPTAVSLGAVTALVYDIVPDPAATTVTITVRLGADWTLAGVLGGGQPAAELAQRLAAVGVAAATTSLLAVQGAGCTVVWNDATPPTRATGRTRPGPSAPRAAKQAATKKTTAKQTATRKTATRKTTATAKQTTAKQTATKKTEAKQTATKGTTGRRPR